MIYVRPRFYTGASATIFLSIGILHALRVYYGWEAVIGGWTVPMWLSWLAVLVAFVLAISGFKYLR